MDALRLLDEPLFMLRLNVPAALSLLGVNVLLGEVIELLPEMRLPPLNDELLFSVLGRAVVRVLLSRLFLKLPLYCPNPFSLRLYLPLLPKVLLPVFGRFPGFTLLPLSFPL